MRNERKISLVIPCRNEEDGIRVVLSCVPDWVDEVVVVDNVCTDRTAARAAAAGARVVSEVGLGYGRACRTGILAATGDVIAVVDGDATYPLDRLSEIVDPIAEGKRDFVSLARRPTRTGWDLGRITRTVGNTILSWAVLGLFSIRVLDSQSGMWALSRAVSGELARGADGMGFSEEIKVRAFHIGRVRALEVPVPVEPTRRIGRSKLRLWRDGLGNLAHLVRLRVKGLDS